MEFSKRISIVIVGLLLHNLLRFSLVETRLTNVALRKPTLHVDTFTNTANINPWSGLAVDGDGNPDYQSGSCSHTASDGITWWIVDLLFTYDIHTTKIVNRYTFGHRLSNFYIYVYTVNPLNVDTLPGSLCVHQKDPLPPGGPHTLECVPPTRGRFVYVWKKSDFLSLCEFEVLVVNSKKETQGTVIPKQRRLTDAALTVYLTRPSFIQCYVWCVDRLPGGFVTHLQLDKNTGKCQCFQMKTMESVDYNKVPDEDYDLVEFVGTVTSM